jgi:hypothetical protein
MGQTETSNASDVSGLSPGTLVEVKGTLRCEEALGQSLGKTALWLGVGGMGAIVVGNALLASGLFVLIG